MNVEVKKYFGHDKYEAEYPVEPVHEGMRLDAFVQLYMPTLSREFVKKKIDRGEVIISGRRPPHKPSVKLHHMEKVKITTYNSPLLENDEWQGKPLDLSAKPEILFEDQDLIVCNKPPFMTTHPVGRHLFYVATVYFTGVYGKTIHSIHRLDRETSGVLLLGKNPAISEKISSLFEENLVKKCYFLIARKKKSRSKLPFIATESMGERPGEPRGMQQIYGEPHPSAKKAETRFEVLIENEEYALLLAFPTTGRQHQIRVHASHHGYPLLGDKYYGGDPFLFTRFKDKVATEEDHEFLQIPRQALHALALSLPYPDLHSRKLYQAPLPRDLENWLKSQFDLFILQDLINKKISAWFDSTKKLGF